ncbi:hypothetical protein D3C86_1852210 [compost metagenome]
MVARDNGARIALALNPGFLRGGLEVDGLGLKMIAQESEHFAADKEYRKARIKRVTKAGSRVTEAKLDEFLMIHIGVILLS